MLFHAIGKWHQKEHGFTLVEVAIVVAVIGLLAAIGFPALSQWIPNYKLKAATQELYGNLQKAKMDAIKTNSTVTTAFDSSTCTTSNGGGYTFTNSGTGDVVASVSFSGGICLTAGDINGFNSRGLPHGATGRAKLENARISRSYTVNQTFAGSIRVQ